jgi:hypothetical protein
MSTAAGAYAWLQKKGWIRGTTSPIVSPQQSRISWYGGDMPPKGPKSVPSATADMNAWVAAGALQN